MKECICKTKYADELSRLEVLTNLIEFAEEQRAKGSPYTDSWADSTTITNWRTTIGYLRTALPKCAVEDFDNERNRQGEFVASLIGENDRGG